MKLNPTKTLQLWTIAVCLALFAACNNTGKEKEKTTAEAATTVTPYTWNQQLFCLNILSNISAHWGDSTSIRDSTKWAVNAVLTDTTVQKYLGTWNVVWGPEVFTGLTGVPANTMYIAQQGNTDNYVVAIAGTDPASHIADILEDANVFTTVKWPTGTGNTGYLSQGTYDGFVILRDVLKDNLVGAREFLAARARKAKQINIYVTGHSLGGFLSPTYALYLSDTKKEPIVGVGSNANIYCLAVAGATPGDSDFSAYYNSQLGPNTIRVWNQLDVVPHAYQPSMLDSIMGLYLPQDTIQKSFPVKIGPLKGPSVPTKDVIFALKTNATVKKYWQLYPNTIVGFTSDMYAAANAPNYISQMLAQHIPAYATFFGIDSFQTNVQRIVPRMKDPFFSQGYPRTSISNYDTAGKHFNNMNP